MDKTCKDKFPLLQSGTPTGELTVEREPLYTCFEARCRLPGEGLWCAWAVGEAGTLRLGVLEPSGGTASIKRRFSRRLTDPLGRLLRGEIRPADGGEPVRWRAAGDPEALFSAPWLRKRLRGAGGALFHGEEGRKYLALPYDCRKSFPLPILFCFAHIRAIDGRWYAVYAFDGEDRPVFS